jgi:hypothetical protein
MTDKELIEKFDAKMALEMGQEIQKKIDEELCEKELLNVLKDIHNDPTTKICYFDKLNKLTIQKLEEKGFKCVYDSEEYTHNVSW